MPGSQSATVLAGSSANNYCILDGNDSQNADVMDFDDGSGPADPRLEKQQQQLLHADFYNDFGDLFDNVKHRNLLKFSRRVRIEEELRMKDKEKHLNGGDDLPGEPDPDTVFKLGEIGNFEPKAQWRSANHGEMGEPVLVDKTLPEVKAAMRDYGFNTYVSDMISLNRSIPDVRMDECKYWHYPEDLPTVSVVIAFHNEGWTPLLRTVHSVLLRSPPHLIKEVIMVDDFSDKDHLKSPLDVYVKQFNGKVKLIRNSEREGLIRTRNIGAKEAVGDVVIFLDAHCEVNVNWLPPLLAPIRQNRKVMTVPIIDGIDKDDWSYRIVYKSADSHYRGIFEWGLLYKETEISKQELARRKHNSEPFRSPTHAGGLFAINKKWFEELGYYDPGLQIWGGEQYELSFKIWQCGGGILFVPCSHVGHVYRSHMPYRFGKLTGKPVISTNMLRVIKTWMDEYEKYYYIREPQAKRGSAGDISSQLELRKSLNCRSFKWYMENVAYDVLVSYPLPPENHVWGEAKNHATGKCIDTMGRRVPGIVGATSCHGFGMNQLIRLNKKGQLTQGEWCITPENEILITNHCVKGTVDGPFTYDEKSEQIITSGLCLTVAESMSSSKLSIEKCDPENQWQKWKWREIYTSTD
uniref:Polypeptide N-acetylgalactosaminyltransferase n=1 Tax=Elaeophora elaphi TaxID=1147741 RepID=A0A158Q6R2_9BILA